MQQPASLATLTVRIADRSTLADQHSAHLHHSKDSLN